ncbi:unnamed protein product [Calicophoron daubneyi]|uniref:ALMS motif domain-containing protein n=1 Tax=Calicophoron daubneyi TaxID=300641 RepID=A0AAV2T1Z1_CALDB
MNRTACENHASQATSFLSPIPSMQTSDRQTCPKIQIPVHSKNVSTEIVSLGHGDTRTGPFVESVHQHNSLKPTATRPNTICSEAFKPDLPSMTPDPSSTIVGVSSSNAQNLRDRQVGASTAYPAEDNEDPLKWDYAGDLASNRLFSSPLDRSKTGGNQNNDSDRGSDGKESADGDITTVPLTWPSPSAFCLSPRTRYGYSPGRKYLFIHTHTVADCHQSTNMTNRSDKALSGRAISQGSFISSPDPDEMEEVPITCPERTSAQTGNPYSLRSNSPFMPTADGMLDELESDEEMSANGQHGQSNCQTQNLAEVDEGLEDHEISLHSAEVENETSAHSEKRSSGDLDVMTESCKSEPPTTSENVDQACLTTSQTMLRLRRHADRVVRATELAERHLRRRLDRLSLSISGRGGFEQSELVESSPPKPRVRSARSEKGTCGNTANASDILIAQNASNDSGNTQPELAISSTADAKTRERGYCPNPLSWDSSESAPTNQDSLTVKNITEYKRPSDLPRLALDSLNDDDSSSLTPGPPGKCSYSARHSATQRTGSPQLTEATAISAVTSVTPIAFTPRRARQGYVEIDLDSRRSSMIDDQPGVFEDSLLNGHLLVSGFTVCENSKTELNVARQSHGECERNESRRSESTESSPYFTDLLANAGQQRDGSAIGAHGDALGEDGPILTECDSLWDDRTDFGNPQIDSLRFRGLHTLPSSVFPTLLPYARSRFLPNYVSETDLLFRHRQPYERQRNQSLYDSAISLPPYEAGLRKLIPDRPQTNSLGDDYRKSSSVILSHTFGPSRCVARVSDSDVPRFTLNERSNDLINGSQNFTTFGRRYHVMPNETSASLSKPPVACSSRFNSMEFNQSVENHNAHLPSPPVLGVSAPGDEASDGFVLASAFPAVSGRPPPAQRNLTNKGGAHSNEQSQSSDGETSSRKGTVSKHSPSRRAFEPPQVQSDTYRLSADDLVRSSASRKPTVTLHKQLNEDLHLYRNLSRGDRESAENVTDSVGAGLRGDSGPVVASRLRYILLKHRLKLARAKDAYYLRKRVVHQLEVLLNEISDSDLKTSPIPEEWDTDTSSLVTTQADTDIPICKTTGTEVRSYSGRENDPMSQGDRESRSTRNTSLRRPRSTSCDPYSSKMLRDTSRAETTDANESEPEQRTKMIRAFPLSRLDSCSARPLDPRDKNSRMMERERLVRLRDRAEHQLAEMITILKRSRPTSIQSRSSPKKAWVCSSSSLPPPPSNFWNFSEGANISVDSEQSNDGDSRKRIEHVLSQARSAQGGITWFQPFDPSPIHLQPLRVEPQSHGRVVRVIREPSECSGKILKKNICDGDTVIVEGSETFSSTPYTCSSRAENGDLPFSTNQHDETIRQTTGSPREALQGNFTEDEKRIKQKIHHRIQSGLNQSDTMVVKPNGTMQRADFTNMDASCEDQESDLNSHSESTSSFMSTLTATPRGVKFCIPAKSNSHSACIRDMNDFQNRTPSDSVFPSDALRMFPVDVSRAKNLEEPLDLPSIFKKRMSRWISRSRERQKRIKLASAERRYAKAMDAERAYLFSSSSTGCPLADNFHTPAMMLHCTDPAVESRPSQDSACDGRVLFSSSSPSPVDRQCCSANISRKAVTIIPAERGLSGGSCVSKQASINARAKDPDNLKLKLTSTRLSARPSRRVLPADVERKSLENKLAQLRANRLRMKIYGEKVLRSVLRRKYPWSVSFKEI